MNDIEDKLRGHFAREAEAVQPPDWSAKVIAQGRRMRSRRRMAMAASGAVFALVLGWGVQHAPGRDSRPSADGYLAASAVPPEVRSAREVAIAGFVERHRDFAWVHESGGSTVCAIQELGEQRQGRVAVRVYVWALCGNRGGSVQAGHSGPLVVDLDANALPTSLISPGDGSYYGASIRRDFPRELWDQVFNQRIDHARLDRDLASRAKGAGN